MPDPKSKIYDFPGAELTVSWDLKRCIHAEECIHGLPQVFDPKRRPWIDASQAPDQEIRRTVERCPTGALHYEVMGDGPAEPQPETNAVTVSADGPLYVSGDLRIGMPSGKVMRENRAALCRCGASQNKPFCDNAHLEMRFADPGRLGDHKLGSGESNHPELIISPAADGPLILDGPVMISGVESEDQAGTRCALCRCGASANRPYCDGSHKRIGFKAD